MKLRDFGKDANWEWFQQLLEWSRKKVTFDNNIDCVFVTASIGTSETEVGHPLKRTPKYILEVASYPNGTAGISFTKPPESERIFVKRNVAGECTLLLM